MCHIDSIYIKTYNISRVKYGYFAVRRKYYEENNLCNFISLDLFWCNLIDVLEDYRVHYNETKDKRYWKELIRLLPESWLQKRTVTMNYENLFAMAHQRKGHKLSEWSKSFIDWARSLPYAQELIFLDEKCGQK